MLIFSIYNIMNNKIILGLVITLFIGISLIYISKKLRHNVELFQPPVVVKPKLITVYTEWCGYSKRFISDDISYQKQVKQKTDANVPERTYVIDGNVYSNKKTDGTLVSDWNLLINSMKDIDTELIDFDKLSKEEKDFYNSLDLEGFPTLYLIYNDKYIKYTDDARKADLIIEWINNITNINEIYNLELYLLSIKNS
jgi:thiol-disulfide isomerase/thioredoxin